VRAICDHMRDWLTGTPGDTWVSMGVSSDGSYGIPRGLVCSLPCRCRGGRWSIVPGKAWLCWVGRSHGRLGCKPEARGCLCQHQAAEKV
jgi:hypothetical protein